MAKAPFGVRCGRTCAVLAILAVSLVIVPTASAASESYELDYFSPPAGLPSTALIGMLTTCGPCLPQYATTVSVTRDGASVYQTTAGERMTQGAYSARVGDVLHLLVNGVEIGAETVSASPTLQVTCGGSQAAGDLSGFSAIEYVAVHSAGDQANPVFGSAPATIQGSAYTIALPRAPTTGPSGSDDVVVVATRSVPIASGGRLALGGGAEAIPCATPSPSAKAPLVGQGLPRAVSSTSEDLSATVNPRGQKTTVHFEYSVVAAAASPAAVAYDARTPEQAVGSDSTDHTVTARISGLLPNSTYHARAVATGPAGSVPGADVTFRTRMDPPPPPPTLGRSVNAGVVSGVVYVLLPGRRRAAVAAAHATAAKGVGFVALTESRQLPVGTVFDTTRGTVRVATATSVPGQAQAGTFAGGLFRVLQNRRERGLTDLALVRPGAAARACSPSGKARTAARRTLPRTVLTLLRATATGRFRSRGRYSSATVRGTSWTTTDRCDGTLTAVARGVVVVTDLRTKRQILLRAGRSYLAKAP